MRFMTLAALFCISLTLCAIAQASPAASRSEMFLLKVMLNDPMASSEIQTRIAVGKPFEFSDTSKGVKITIKGKLSPRQKNTYHLKLTIVEWASEKTNNAETYGLDLVPGKMWNGGVVSSFLYRRDILLTRLSSE